MSSSTSFSDMWLPKQCYAKLPYMTKDRSTWETCATKRAEVNVKILAVIVLLIALVVLWMWNKRKQMDPTAPFPTGTMFFLALLVVLVYVLYPPYATRSAAVEYDAYKTEKREFLQQNPGLTLRDYLKYKMDEANTRHFGTISGAQTVMAGAFAADALSGLAGLFGGRR